MLIYSLFLSTILVGISYWAVFCSKHPRLFVILTVIAFNFCPIFLSAFSPPVALLSISLALSVFVWKKQNWRPRVFVFLSLYSTVIAYFVSAGIALVQLRGLQERYPIVSLAEKLPLPKKQSSPGTLAWDVEAYLTTLEQSVERSATTDSMMQMNRKNLANLHEHAVKVFVDRPGFGAGRMTSDWPLRNRTWDIKQPGARSASLTTEIGSPATILESDGEIKNMHNRTILDFVNLRGWGYVQDRAHVTGFKSHRFMFGPPEPAGRLSLQTLDLVGLVVHDEPVAYVSDNLPNMDELREAPTRELDPFEAAGLKDLVQGHDLFIREGQHFTRMLGAIRSAKQCVECHGGQRGDLLGAFSYTFTREERK